MWIMIPKHGFYSAVEHQTDTDRLNLRARSKADLQRFVDWHANRFPDAPRLEILQFSPSDYPYRVFPLKSAFGLFITEAALDIDYGNFKNEVTRRMSARRHDTYSRVWSALLAIEDEPDAAVTKHKFGSSKTTGAFADFEPIVDNQATRDADTYSYDDDRCPDCEAHRPGASDYIAGRFAPGSRCTDCGHTAPALPPIGQPNPDPAAADITDPFFVGA